MSKEVVDLQPRFTLDDNWKRSGEIPSTEETTRSYTLQPDERQLLNWIRETRVEIAEIAYTEKIRSDEKFDYLKSEIGMNIIVPKGRIEELRFLVTLDSEKNVMALDGFPKDQIDEKNIVEGKVKVAVDKAFKFIPVLGPLTGLFEVELKPWEFSLGSLKKVNVDFSGGPTFTPEWYFREDGIKHDLRVALTLRKSIEVEKVVGNVKAAWCYNPGFLRKTKIETDEKTIQILE